MSSLLRRALPQWTWLSVLVLPTTAASAQALPTLVSSASATCVQAVGLRWTPSPDCAALGATLLLDVALASDSSAVKPTHWVEGMVIGALIGGFGFAVIGHGFCEMSEGRDCSSVTMRAGLLGAFVGGMTGALIGGGFSESPARQPQNASST